MKLELPKNPEAERSVLGSILIDPGAITYVQDTLRPQDFYDEVNRTIFAAMLKILDTGDALDTTILASHLRRHGQLQDVGGLMYLDSLASETGVSAYVETYAAEVRDASQRRAALRYLQEAISAVIKSPTAKGAIEVAESKLLKLATSQTQGEWIDSPTGASMLAEEIEKSLITQDVDGVTTGFRDIDSIIRALRPGNLVTLAARPSVGKTALALAIAYNNVAGAVRRNVAMFSLEMGVVDVYTRFLALDVASNTPSMTHLRDFSKLSDRQMERAKHGLKKLGGISFWMDDSDTLTIGELSSRARKLTVEHPLDLIIIDYLTLITPSDDDPQNITQRVTIHTRKLKSLARELGVPILMLAQLNREIEKRPNPVPLLSDLRDSGSIEQDSDIVMFIDRRDRRIYPEADPTYAQLIVAKYRQGAPGACDLAWDADRARYHDWNGPTAAY